MVLLERDATVIAAFAVRDELRPEAPEAIRQLRNLGIEPVMLTGDNARTANAMAEAAGITAVYADLLPEEKARLLPELFGGRKIAMVGDGVNDAPAPAAADIGIAMGTMGPDVAIETADVALMGEDLRHLPRSWIIAILIPLAAFGVLGLATVVLMHEVAEVCVILNAIRAARTQPLPGGAPLHNVASAVHHVTLPPRPQLSDTCCAPTASLTTAVSA